MNSFFPDGINSWNYVISHFDNIPSKRSLRNTSYRLFARGKGTYGIHDPSGLRYLFQLRFGLSPLRYHKKRHTFIDTPSDKCSCNHRPEGANHFLFSCPLFATGRETLKTIVTRILQKYNLNQLKQQCSLYLYGHQKIK